MQIPPAAVLASWPEPNYVNPITTGPGIIIMHAILFPTVLTIVGLRIFSRVRISGTFGWDDAFILVALIPMIAFVVITLLILYHLHWDRHIWDVLPSTTVLGLKLTLSSEILFSAAAGLTRLSMLILTRRIIASSKGFLRTLTNFAIWFIIIEQSIFIIVMIFACRPISASWTFNVAAKCINNRLHLLVAGILSTLSDFLIVLLPIPIVLRLQLPRRQLIAVTMLFAAGFLICAAGAARTFFTYKATSTWDATWYAYGANLSSSIELYVGIICASVPPTKAFFSKYVPKLLSSVHMYNSVARDKNHANSSTSTISNSKCVSNRAMSEQVGENIELSSVTRLFRGNAEDATRIRTGQEIFGRNITVRTSTNKT